MDWVVHPEKRGALRLNDPCLFGSPTPFFL